MLLICILGLTPQASAIPPAPRASRIASDTLTITPARKEHTSVRLSSLSLQCCQAKA